MAADDGPAIIDLGGPGSSLTPWSETFAIVLSFSIDDKVAFSAAEASIRTATLEAARDLAVITVGHPPDAVTSLERQQLTGELPAVCAILQVGSEGPGRDTFLYGEPVAGIAPRVLDPLEILDGALTAGAYGQAGTRNPTAFYQRNRLLEQLMREHGRRLDFTGVVLTLGYLDDISAKEEMAGHAARLALETGADGAILTTFGGGNSHTDSMLTCQSVEALGMRTVVILAETNGGLTDHVPVADAIVSTGNEDELVAAWRPERVVGGNRLPDGRNALDAGPLSTLAYVGSVCQLGDLRLTAAP
jgi:glycine reductase